jgi:hypothetical protein
MDLADYIRQPGSLHLLFQLQRGPKSLGYLVERSATDRTTLRKRLTEAKELGLVGERAESDGNTYELDLRGTNLIGLLEDRDGFDKKAYLDKRREIIRLQQQLEERQDELSDIVADAGTIIADLDSLDEDEDIVRLETE